MGREHPLLASGQWSANGTTTPVAAASFSSTGAAVSLQPHDARVTSVRVTPASDDYHEQSDAWDEDEADAEEKEEKPLAFPSMIVMPGKPQIICFLLLGVLSALAFTVLRRPLENCCGVTSGDLLRFGSIPLISIAFTYCHIWLALWMTFYPLEYFGCLQIPGTNTGLGWQGIIPFKAEKVRHARADALMCAIAV